MESKNSAPEPFPNALSLDIPVFFFFLFFFFLVRYPFSVEELGVQRIWNGKAKKYRVRVVNSMGQKWSSER